MDMAVAILIRFTMLFYTGIIPQMHCHKLPESVLLQSYLFYFHVLHRTKSSDPPGNLLLP